MKMQQESLEAKLRTGLKEKTFFYPVTFENLESILRNNFNSVPNLEESSEDDQLVRFYARSNLANEAFQGTTNPRILIAGKVLTSLCHLLPEDKKTTFNKKNHQGLTIDTFTSNDKTSFYKANPNEMYPDHVLVYRDLSGPADGHTSRLTDFLQHCQVSYRSGTRYNPQEQTFKG